MDNEKANKRNSDTWKSDEICIPWTGFFDANKSFLAANIHDLTPEGNCIA